MIRLTLITTAMILSATIISMVSAADTGSITSTSTLIPVMHTSSGVPLLLSTVSATTATNVVLVFNQPIHTDSLRVRIVDQATSENMKIDSITGSIDPMGAVITTAVPLTAGASYVLTIVSALSTTEMTISAGVDSIREFSVPATLTGTSLNAPTNPSAVIVATGWVTPQTPITQSGSATGTILPQNTDLLPATGTPTTGLVILAAISAFVLLLVRRRV